MLQAIDIVHNKDISKTVLQQLSENDELRKDLVRYFREHQNRDFAVTLLNAFIEYRGKPGEIGSMEDLMLACYILGLHQQLSDCLLIWNAKNTDFDSYCGVDIQLVVFAGVEKTIAYLESIEAKDALEYVTECKDAGDFDDLEKYYSPDKFPWFI